MILVTGGTGFLGSHTCVELLNNGYEVVICDNLYNSSEDIVEKIEQITNRSVTFYNVDVSDYDKMDEIFSKHDISGIIHFAGYKAVGESVEKPLMYYRNNLNTTITLCELMQKHDVKNIIFSSSATVYGEENPAPYKEDMPLGKATNPYGNTKIISESILTDFYNANKNVNVSILRYFNPIGAHESGLIGENPNGIPNNLFPYVLKVAAGELPELGVFGNDYPTPDGTGIRDYIHVVDLACAHVLALNQLEKKDGLFIYNIGTGIGHSVMEIISGVEKASGRKVKYSVKPRRIGDLAICYANAEKAEKELGFKAKYDIDKMCSDGWNYMKNEKQI